MAELIVVYWRDIPSQVIAKRGRRDQAKVMLHERFQVAIDAAAMRGDAGDTDSYLEEWRKSDPVECGEDLEAEATAKAQELEAAYDKERVRALVQNGGNEPA